ncbi:Demethylmenaquinone methyltransferase [Nocardioides dokdonensis FR1436]|uniref:Demethylmenaquinone methyltransferase n=1 Tax=Nocardioides dokdonensis FR1436 TaxID=1300347 RepID=A0A1A9GM46_9ACTN|nr:class I SAM-dependent methyltransferase [Nocardioides dokdonensis]ANH39369.1 Demethylmenaquinone methyltransferase [Nocardioides dokdonensis FR1436]
MAPDADTTWAADMPAAYDALLGPVLFAPYAEDMAARVAACHPSSVLELAAGTGRLTSELVAALPAAQVTATDLNQAMVDHGRGRVPQARWSQADAMDLSFEDGSVDVVVCQFGVMFFPDRVAALGEAARVLAPGGSLLVSTWDTVETNHLAAQLVVALERVFPEDPPAFVVRVPHGYADVARFRADARAAGLVDVEVETVALTSRAPSARSFARGVCTGSPLRAGLAERGDLAEATERVADELTALLGEGPVSGPMSAHVLRGARP